MRRTTIELFNQTPYGIENFSLSFSANDNERYIKALSKVAAVIGDKVLSDREEIVFKMIVQDGIPQEECAERLHCSQSTISRIFKSARDKLRYALEISSLAIKKYIEVTE